MTNNEYLGGKKWRDITREERFFCAELYFEIKGKERDFVTWLNTKTDLKLDENAEWEIGFEVCFYRDYIDAYGKKYGINKTEFPRKRTFDLCLFGQQQMVIIEAKAYCGFEIKQLDSFTKDKEQIKNLLGRSSDKEMEVLIIGLTSSGYLDRANIFRIKNQEKKYFDGIITWNDLFRKYGNEIFLQADEQKRLNNGQGKG